MHKINQYKINYKQENRENRHNNNDRRIVEQYKSKSSVKFTREKRIGGSSGVT